MSSLKHYDLIVIGFGGVGSATLYHAAKKGWTTLGIDQFGPAHNKGSSHGQTRIIRKAYFEHPNYVPLAEEAFERWDELNKRHRTRPETKPLFEQAGVLQIGRPESEVINGVLRSAKEHDLKLEQFTPEQIHHRLPILNVQPDHIGLFEPEAGFLRVEHCVAAHLAQAKKRGAELISDCTVVDWNASESGLEVRTENGTFRADRLAICAGAWSARFLPGINIELNVISKQQNWYQIDRIEQKYVNDFPVVFIEEDDGEQFYCIPELDSHGMKVCRHTGGDVVEDADGLDRKVDQDDLNRNEAFMDLRLHHSKHRLVHSSTCMYTMSADGHFIIDRHPQHANVAFATGLSGHGFKFTPVLGHRMVEMLDGQCDSQIDFLSLDRFRQV
ncbi:N-methyl-L-tryptophan oxidase [Mariniblastus fucicola]|nr:N-methyl-L-tryptophan oxidase [Mariniblastus fucicola]